MKKLMNAPEAMPAEGLDGFAAAHADIVVLGPGRSFVRRRTLSPGKAALVSGGGSGHEPMHVGFVGQGMLDAACPGHVFTSPTPGQVAAAAQAVDTGAGCLFIVKNYEGDVMNFEMGREMAHEMSAGRVETLVVRDDVATEDAPDTTGRRGVAGTLIVEKCLGAAAEAGAGLGRLMELGGKVVSVTRTMGVALTSCTVPAVGRPTFPLGEGEMEVGVGIHGEPGRRRAKLGTAQAITAEMVGTILRDLAPRRGAEVLLLVNGYGGTPPMELYLVAGCATGLLRDAGLIAARHLTGTYATSLDMAGCSISVTLLDDELRGLWDAPVRTAALRWGA
jgi:dihydroxyacetone kinase-like protein